MAMTVTLLLHCPDRPGIIADITNFITENGGNVVYLAQFVDHVENVFNMRIEWSIDDFLIPKEKISDYFGTLYARKYDMNFRLYFSDTRPRMAIFVSRMSHCLFDLLARYSAGEWNVEIPLIVSNHPDMQHVAEMFGIPYYLYPITKENKMEQESAMLDLLKENNIDFIVLARYMQIIGDRMIAAYPNKMVVLGECGWDGSDKTGRPQGDIVECWNQGAKWGLFMVWYDRNAGNKTNTMVSDVWWQSALNKENGAIVVGN